MKAVGDGTAKEFIDLLEELAGKEVEYTGDGRPGVESVTITRNDAWAVVHLLKTLSPDLRVDWCLN
jgi:hypothetical protein